MALTLAGRRVLLTGASGGLGAAIARALHARGASLVLSGRRLDALEQLRSELRERVELIPADLAAAADVRALPQQAGEVDVLVANAGLPGTGLLESFSAQEVDRVLDVNLRSAVQLTRALLPGMKERGAGHLVFVSSISGKVATGQASLYNATKFGLRGFGFSLWEELRGSGVGVTTVFPGAIGEAGMWADAGINTRRVSTRRPEDVGAAVVRGIEQGRVEIDVAPLVVRLGGWFAGPAPSVVSRIFRAAGGEQLTERLAEAQRPKR